MSHSAEVGVVVTPCAGEEALRSTLAAIAHCGGLSAHDLLSGPAGGDSASVLLCADASQLPIAALKTAVVIVGDALSAPNAVARRYGVPRRAALDYSAHCLAAATQAAELGNAVVIRTADLIADPRRGVDTLCEAVGASVSEDDRRLIAERCAVALAAGQPPEEREEPFSDALALYDYGPARVGARAWCARTLFFSGAPPEEPCPDVIDVTGRPRMLLSGPGFPLPPGRWRLAARLSFCGWAARNSFAFEAAAGGEMRRVDIRPNGAGDWEAALIVDCPRVAPLEARISLTAPAFHGDLRFHGMRIERLAP